MPSPEDRATEELIRRIKFITDSLHTFETETGVPIHVKDFSGLMMCHPKMGRFIRTFLYHESEYCNYIKGFKLANERCVLLSNELLLRRLLRDSRNQSTTTPDCFRGACHGGIEEYVFPITHSGIIIGALLAGAYRTDLRVTERTFDRFQKKYRMNVRKLKAYYEASTTECPKDFARYVPFLKMAAETVSLLTESCIDYQALSVYLGKSETAKHAYVRPGTATMSRQEIILRAEAYIEQNLKEKIRVSDMAFHCMCSVSTLNHLFPVETGRSIPEYVAVKRCEHAALLLTTTDWDINTISGESGFSSAPYFSAVFKKHYETTPTLYRRKHGNPSQFSEQYNL